MSWIQDNKFLAGLAGVTVVLAGGIFYYGSSQGSEYDEQLEEYGTLNMQLRKLQTAKPYPSPGNERAKMDNITKYQDVIKDVRNTFAGFKAGKMEKISPEQFSNLRVEMDKSLRKAFQDSGTKLPQDTAFGFETYVSGSARSGATGMLNYELNAVQWLLEKLADAKPTDINSILRTPLAVEESGKAAAAPQPVAPRGKKGGRRAPAAPPVEQAYTLMPMEISFTTSEPGLREFLKSMVNSNQYFFAIRALRIRNEKQVPPNVKDAGFPAGAAPAGGDGPAGGGEDDPFAGIALPGAEEGDDENDDGAVPVPVPKPKVVKGQRILKQVLGAEKLHVFIRFDIVFIKGSPDDAESSATSALKP